MCRLSAASTRGITVSPRVAGGRMRHRTIVPASPQALPQRLIFELVLIQRKALRPLACQLGPNLAESLRGPAWQHRRSATARDHPSSAKLDANSIRARRERRRCEPLSPQATMFCGLGALIRAAHELGYSERWLIDYEFLLHLAAFAHWRLWRDWDRMQRTMSPGSSRQPRPVYFLFASRRVSPILGMGVRFRLFFPT